MSTEQIRVSRKVKRALDKKKTHKRESYNDVIERLLWSDKS
jgi:predicted CopG family antitoxin